jgi:hypothetical protein
MKINLKYLVPPMLIPLSLSAGDLGGHDAANKEMLKLKNAYVTNNDMDQKSETPRESSKLTSESARAFLDSDNSNASDALKYLLENGNEGDYNFAIKYISNVFMYSLKKTKMYNDRFTPTKNNYD